MAPAFNEMFGLIFKAYWLCLSDRAHHEHARLLDTVDAMGMCDQELLIQPKLSQRSRGRIARQYRCLPVGFRNSSKDVIDLAEVESLAANPRERRADAGSVAAIGNRPVATTSGVFTSC